MSTAFWSATKLAQALRAKKLGAVELFDLYAARVRQHNRALNAICVMDLDAGRKAARAADRAKGKKGPLHGLPMTVKESFNVAGWPTTRGLSEHKDNVAHKDALAVARLKRAGAIVFGKTNVPVLLADWQSFNPVYGTTNNPWDLLRTPGGSSGGSAAALAAGLTGLELGSDIGASIRNPAHYCGVYGHKPTWAVCSSQGHSMPGAVHPGDIAAIGPLARSADDLRLAMDIIAGSDDIDGAGWQLALPKPKLGSLRKLRVAVMPSHSTAEVDAAVSGAIERLASALAKKGARVSDRARPDFNPDEAHKVYIAVLRAATSNRQLPHHVELWERLSQERPATDMSYEAQAARANVMRHKEWLGWSNRRHQMRLAWAEFFRDWDVLLCPAAATPAFPQNQRGERWERMIEVNGKPQPSTTQLFWAGYSGMCNLPSTVAPIELAGGKLPVGVQIVGPQYGDYLAIEVARLIEKEYYAFTPPPGFD
ncbi:MAG: amidase [Betaproteobacteria bacterium]|nr:amidase [Betaproteobacteria bacterium]